MNEATKILKVAEGMVKEASAHRREMKETARNLFEKVDVLADTTARHDERIKVTMEAMKSTVTVGACAATSKSLQLGQDEMKEGFKTLCAEVKNGRTTKVKVNIIWGVIVFFGTVTGLSLVGVVVKIVFGAK